jgi:hypothetical protein
MNNVEETHVIFSLFNLGFFHIFHIFSLFNLPFYILSISYHYSTYFCSVFSISFHYSNMKDLCVSHNYTQRNLLLLRPPSSSSNSSSKRISSHTHLPQNSSTSSPNTVQTQKKTKHIMKISHINVTIYDKTATFKRWSLLKKL